MNYKTVLFPILYAIAALVIFSMVKSPGLFDNRTGVIAMTEFEAHKPFQYRVLMPAAVRLVESITPASIENSVNQEVFKRASRMAILGRHGIDDDKAQRLGKYGYRCVVYLILNWLALFGFLLTLRYLALAVTAFSRLTCDMLPLGMIVVMPIFFDIGNIMYDFSHLFLFTLGLLMLYRERWPVFMIVFALAVLNKETAVMLTIIFAVYFYSKLTRQMFLKLLLMQISIFLIIKISLYLLFQSNPGGAVEWHLMWNLKNMSYLSFYFHFELIGKGLFSPYYIPITVPHGFNLPMLAVIIASIAYKWKEKPEFLKKATAYFPLMLILALIMGLVNELRAYYDALPIIYLLGMIGVIKFMENLKSKIIRT